MYKILVAVVLTGCGTQVRIEKQVEAPPALNYTPLNYCVASSEQLTKAIFKARWNSKNLNQELKAIAYNESYNNKYLDHVASVNGPYSTAFGPLGLKPSTAHLEWKSSHKMQAKYPNLQKPLDFLAKFTTDPVFYNEVANQHFWRLKQIAGGDAVRAAYGWRFGPGFITEPMQVISQDAYIVKFVELTGFPVIFEPEYESDRETID